MFTRIFEFVTNIAISVLFSPLVPLLRTCEKLLRRARNIQRSAHEPCDPSNTPFLLQSWRTSLQSHRRHTDVTLYWQSRGTP